MTRPRKLFIALIVVALVVSGFLLPIKDYPIQLAEWARGTGALGVTVFILAYIVSTILGLPGAILTLAAGFAYGPAWGLVVASPASVVGATCAFLLGRTLLHDWAVRRVGQSARIRSIDAAVAHDGFKLVLLLRLSPLFPFNVLNYALSLSRVSLPTYVAASFLGMLPGTAMYVYLGSLAPAAAELTSAGGGGKSLRTALYAAGLIATIAVAVVGTRAARRALDPALTRAS